MYNLIIPGSVAEDILSLDDGLKKKVINRFLPEIQKDPRIGLPYDANGTALYRYTFFSEAGNYRIVYEITEANKIVIVILIACNEDFYRVEEEE